MNALVGRSQTRVAVIDLNSGNLLSLQTAIEAAGCELKTVQKPDLKMLSDFDVLVMPGQGRFAYVMQQIKDLGWYDFLLEWVRNGKRLVGICVGMQVLFEGSDEDPEATGLGLFNGRCHKLQHPKTPMVGWAQLNSYKLTMKDQFAYFVNSYAITECPFGTAKVNYGSSFCAAVQRGNLYGFQFHPEKSGQFGRELIKHVCG
ncbi:imidazole glycerol phosphate synthase subunit HisH [Marinicella sp. S1101]|uniref:imidazole glycerol phosphate synthase subunit HisH n=1 Tax=Marinicella marina TaxID=2996016 RepID=UPI002260E62A|nr:imidazole glycerol phosphate synthase subunit HisH [Marinicella marina]MCX7553273.1 imidazole glycerol phosphate synthase subunit HisH [Marinicella marina]MDJ1139005.1 imidazole glycerol phosphate synthase subunit HisH [Marinicella marina]